MLSFAYPSNRLANGPHALDVGINSTSTRLESVSIDIRCRQECLEIIKSDKPTVSLRVVSNQSPVLSSVIDEMFFPARPLSL